jgi:hypothetical protein
MKCEIKRAELHSSRADARRLKNVTAAKRTVAQASRISFLSPP